MKLRIRSVESKETLRVDTPSPSSLQDLRNAIAQKISAPPETIHLSLNRKDELLCSSSPQESLQSLGITSGDLIFYTLSPKGFSEQTLIQAPPTRTSLRIQRSNLGPEEVKTLKASENPESHNCSKAVGTLVSDRHPEETIGFSEVVDETLIDPDGMDIDKSITVGKSCSVPRFLKKVFKEEADNAEGDCRILFEKIRVLQAGLCSNTLAWNNRIGRVVLFCRAFCLPLLVAIVLATTAVSANLSPNFYDKVCPKALPTIKRVVDAAVKREPRMGGSLLRLHFHDCFVNGCDGSLLLDDAPNIVSEKTSLANNNSARGFEVVDRIKSEVNKVCGRPVVSCADILAVAARDSVVSLGGPTWEVQLGRRDSTTASRAQSNKALPTPFMNLPALINNFKKVGLDKRDLVALSGGHTLGFATCATFKNRIYNSTAIDPNFARARKQTCPRNGGDSNLAPLDLTAAKFDTQYFINLVKRRGLLQSDNALFSGGETDALVKSYRLNSRAFSADFARSMIKMGNIKPLIGNKGQIRVNCRRVN